MKSILTKKRLIAAFFLSILCATLPYSKTIPEKPPEANADTAPPIEPVSAPDTSLEYAVPIVYYNQADPQWGSYLYGGSDPMSTYGCGPTVVAMVVSSLTSTPITPPQAADWAAANGYWSRGHGSAHSLIPDSASHFGLSVETLNIKTPKALKLALSYGKLAVFLMGPGDFTTSGHFVIAYGVRADGTIMVADSANPQNLQQNFSAETLLAQVSSAKDAAGPVWIISP